MQLTSSSFNNFGEMPAECAFAKFDAETHMALSTNMNPDLKWTDLPAGTKSLALICYDPDVPTALDDFNREGRTVAAATPRMNLYHWALVDIPPDLNGIKKGEFSDAVVPRGKPGPEAPLGTRQGLNGYTDWFRSDPNMAGNYFGYDGPCPPWNDEVAHRYVFSLYALDVAKCPVDGVFSASDVINAIQGHVLQLSSLTGFYSLNPNVRI